MHTCRVLIGASFCIPEVTVACPYLVIPVNQLIVWVCCWPNNSLPILVAGVPPTASHLEWWVFKQCLWFYDSLGQDGTYFKTWFNPARRNFPEPMRFTSSIEMLRKYWDESRYIASYAIWEPQRHYYRETIAIQGWCKMYYAGIL